MQIAVSEMGENSTRARRLCREHFGVEIGTEPPACACTNHGDGSDCCVSRIRQTDLFQAMAAAGRRPDRRSDHKSLILADLIA
jgi:hypothetical protein